MFLTKKQKLEHKLNGGYYKLYECLVCGYECLYEDIIGYEIKKCPECAK